MIALPDPPTRTDLRGSAFAGAVVVGAVALVTTWLSGSFWWLATGVVIGSGLVSLGTWRPERMAPAYRRWNQLTYLAGRAARLALTGACFAITSVAGRAGTRLAWGPATPGMTGWRARRLPPPDRAGTLDAGSGVPWARAFLAWTRSADNAWAVVLLPYIWLFRTLRRKERSSLDEEIYTLF